MIGLGCLNFGVAPITDTVLAAPVPTGGGNGANMTFTIYCKYWPAQYRTIAYINSQVPQLLADNRITAESIQITPVINEDGQLKAYNVTAINATATLGTLDHKAMANRFGLHE